MHRDMFYSSFGDVSSLHRRLYKPQKKSTGSKAVSRGFGFRHYPPPPPLKCLSDSPKYDKKAFKQVFDVFKFFFCKLQDPEKNPPRKKKSWKRP